MGAGPKADSFARYLEFPEYLLLPSVIVFEVYKRYPANMEKLLPKVSFLKRSALVIA